MEAVRHRKSSLFFINGPAGKGKTFLYRTLLVAIRNEGHIAFVTTLSGITAIIMLGGRTAHSRFKIPIPILPTSTCRVNRQSDLGDLLCETSVIIWDEASMAHRNTFEAVDRTLQDLLHCDLPFGGKIVTLGGDFRQVLPVVTHGSRYQTVNACVTYLPIWDYVQVLPLTENMHAKTNLFYVEMLLKIEDNSQKSISDNMIKVPSDMIIPWEGEQSISHLIQSVFPDLHQNALYRYYIMERALITPKNIHVNELNDQVLQLFPNNEITYHSFDHAEDNDKQLYQLEFLNSISKSQLPPHKLSLKVGCSLIVLRNIDPKNGVCNGTRVLLRSIRENVLHVEIITRSLLFRQF